MSWFERLEMQRYLKPLVQRVSMAKSRTIDAFACVECVACSCDSSTGPQHSLMH